MKSDAKRNDPNASRELFWNANVYGFGDIVSENDVDCGTFDRGEEVVLTAVPAGDNYEFVRWSDGSTANPRTLVANRDYDIVAEFRHKTETTGSLRFARIWNFRFIWRRWRRMRAKLLLLN